MLESNPQLAPAVAQAYVDAKARAYREQRASMILPSGVAGDPLPFDSKVKEWKYWVANIREQRKPDAPLPDAEPVAGAAKDTTHIAIIDKDGNVFDSTPSGGWIPGAVILGKTGIGMSIRGEQFWLDKTKAAQLRPRSRPRYTLTPGLVMKNGQPFMALGSPGGDNQEQTVLQAFLDIVEFWPDWYPNVHTAFEWPRVQTLHFHGSFWPHNAGLNVLNVEANMPDAVFNELKARGHNAQKIPAYGMNGCATAVIVDPATSSRIAGGERRRDCYAIAY